MIESLNIRVTPRIAATPKLLQHYVARELKISPDRLKRTEIVRRSIDARQRNVYVNLTVNAHIDHIEPTQNPEPLNLTHLSINAPKAIIVGSGPAGLFAALTLIEQGIRPIVLERGKDVDSRRKDLAKISREDAVDPDSNYAFGEGGAGTYSDGKLYTRSKKRGDIKRILEILYLHGAPHDILVDAHPHIGTNLLPDIIKSIRHSIEEYGGSVLFGTRVIKLILNEEKDEVMGVETLNGEKFFGPVILATGHSARDTYLALHQAGITLLPKGIAVGVRLEHPSNLIDRLQYHSSAGRGKYLPAAEYSFLTRIDDRAVYSFCMCPGGIVVPASTSSGELVVNGMSPSNRGSRWSNSGMVVEILPEDVKGQDPLRMLRFQQGIEQRFFQDSESHNAPAQRMKDFVDRRLSSDLPKTSYAPGIHSGRIDKLLPYPVAYRLMEAFKVFGERQPGFLTNHAVLIGCETRTSAPVRIPRHSETLNHVEIRGLFPAGEGAGYAGGIVSAAIDGQRCGLALAQSLNKKKAQTH